MGQTGPDGASIQAEAWLAVTLGITIADVSINTLPTAKTGTAAT
jgi:hypothetical protein